MTRPERLVEIYNWLARHESLAGRAIIRAIMSTYQVTEETARSYVEALKIGFTDKDGCLCRITCNYSMEFSVQRIKRFKYKFHYYQ
jgi:hypothetical protein